MNIRGVALFVATASLLALLGMYGWRMYLNTVNAAREVRVTAVIDPAPAPLPTELPLTGAAGTEADGYPLRTADGPALRSLLWHKKYQQLTSYVEQYQAELERDWHKEYWLVDATKALSSGEKALLPLLDAWVAATPESFAPYLARGEYWVHAAYALRGTSYAAETAGVDMEAMHQALAKGHADLSRALAIKPGLVTAFRVQIIAHMALAQDAERDVAFSKARIACPHCMQHRAVYLFALMPRWGGSYEEMDSFASRERDRENPRTRFLAGYADFDRIHNLRKEKDYDAALSLAERLCALGDYSPFLLERAEVREQRNEWLLAQTDLDRALQLHPGMPDILFERARVALNTGQWETAGTDLLAGLRVDPADSTGRHLFAYTMKRLIYEGWELHKAGKRDAALRLLNLAAELEPGNRELQQRRAYIVAGNEPPTDAKVAALDAKARSAPDDFDAAQQLDYNLAAQGKFDQVIELWSKFLAKHPDHARAYLERGGAYFRSGRRAEASVDARRACELGLSEGCMRAKQLGGG